MSTKPWAIHLPLYLISYLIKILIFLLINKRNKLFF